MKKHRTSIITPSYNQGDYIERTIRSVIGQNRSHPEYLIVDGGSTDQTINVLKQYEKQHPGFFRWVSEKDGGQSNAINKGIKATSGEIIGVLNSDDIYYPGAIEAVQDLFESRPEVDVVYGDAYHIDEDDNIIEPYFTEPWNFERLKEVCFLCQPAVFFRRRVVETCDLLDESLSYCMDYQYWIRLARGGAKFAHLQRVLAGSRLYQGAKTVRSRVEVHAEINGMLRKQFGNVPDKWLINYAHAVVEAYRFRRTDRFRFVGFLSAVSFYASLRWNRKISWNILRTILQSSIGAIRGYRKKNRWAVENRHRREGMPRQTLRQAKRDGS